VNCTEAYDAILEAELAELRGEGEGDLARHLRECAACRATARRVLEALGALDLALEGEDAAVPTARTGRVRLVQTRRVAAVGLLAAAAAVAILVRRPQAPERARITARPVASVAVEVDVSTSTRQVAVLSTADPNITVVWYF
jgi:hypothetical protein